MHVLEAHRAAHDERPIAVGGDDDRLGIVHWLSDVQNAGGQTTLVDLLFLDAAKGQHREYIDLAEPLLSERALLVIDNLLAGGEVALPDGADRARSDEAIDSARALKPQLPDSRRWLGSVLPIGGGVGFAARL